MKKKIIIGLPRLGNYSELIKKFLERLGCKVILPPPTTRESLKKGIAYAPEMYCIPFKFNLANYFEILDIYAYSNYGTDEITLVQYKTAGMCKFHTYYITQTLILKNLGYKFKGIYPFRSGLYLFKDIAKITNQPILKVLISFYKTYQEVKKLEAEENKDNEGDIKIGIFGEIFTCLDSTCNLDLIRKLKKLNCYVENAMSLSGFIIAFFKEKIGRARRLQKQVKRIFPEKIGGHGLCSIRATLDFIERKFDGIIFVRPLTCSPETAVEPVILDIAEKAKMPLLIQNYDEFISDINLENRLEAFTELIRWKKRQ